MGKSSARKSDPDVRLRILRFLKARGSASIREAARLLRISHEGARKQLATMEANGWVLRSPSETVTGKRGRPREAYSVTAAGDRLFPKAYDRLSADLIAGVAQAGGPALMRTVLASLADIQVGAWEPLLAGKTPEEKLESLKGLYLKDDPFMSVERRDGDLILVERNCPFLNVAMEHPALCSLSVATLERLLGHPVVREEKFQTGHGRCVFRIRLGQPYREKNFRLESEAPAA
jgi:predicted ArsR family transcriptional regulator